MEVTDGQTDISVDIFMNPAPHTMRTVSIAILPDTYLNSDDGMSCIFNEFRHCCLITIEVHNFGERSVA